ncbi:matrixin family metalloprotease [Tardiphaga sp.]|uniref:matrixin family metalloprotease n=1 Tax=Tardiphaga sp. TaxID=1926292 RepID=UPI002631D63F|nr:matrixin family metalloprotease [Tardiphaga sp.]MDB5617756.1 calcium-binding toxin-like protein [Tardiphaga sp.]
MRPRNLTGGTDDPAFDTFRFDAPLFDSTIGHPAITPASEASNPLAQGTSDSMWDGAPPAELTTHSDYVTFGGKWGPSSAFGTTGGTVTWSLAGAGLSNASGYAPWFTGNTVALSSFLGFDYTAVLTQAFAAWSTVANINFVQVADGGGNMGTGATANIRISGGYIDGATGSNILATAWSPGSGTSGSSALSGDVNFDNGNTWTASMFLAVATHEIGHSLGLDHTSVVGSIMLPIYNPSITTPQADDIAGMQAIYGARAGAPGPTDDYGDVSSAVALAYGQVSVNATATGTLETIGDRDTFSVTLQQGRSYWINVQGARSGNGTLQDPYVRVTGGGLSAENDDAAISNTDSRVRFTPIFTGIFNISVGAYADNGTGTYTVTVSGRATAPLDFRADGISDLLWSNSTTGQIGLWNPDGGSGFGFETINQGDPSWQLLGTGDFNNDSRADMVWRNVSNGAVGLWNSNGSGGFTYQVNNPGDMNWQIQGIADLNADGRSDLIWTNPISGQLGIWYTGVSGSFTYQVIGQTDRNWQIAGTGDFNNDGRADILWRNTVTSQSGLWYSTGSGFSVAIFGQSTDSSWQIQGTDDFNGDGRADILWRNLSSGQLGFWTNNGSGGFTYRTVDVGDQNWQIRGTGDYNGDGRSDLFWGNAATGQVGMWYTSASGGFTTQIVNQGDPAWGTIEGNDLLVASPSHPILIGTPGATTFAIRPGSGVDGIYNFETTQDVLQFSPSVFANFAAAMSHASQVGANTVFSIDANNSVTLANIDRNTLTTTNFRFA